MKIEMAESEEDEVLRIIQRELTAIHGSARSTEHTAVLFELVTRESVIRMLSDSRFQQLRSAIVYVGHTALVNNYVSLTPELFDRIQDTILRFDADGRKVMLSVRSADITPKLLARIRDTIERFDAVGRKVVINVKYPNTMSVVISSPTANPTESLISRRKFMAETSRRKTFRNANRSNTVNTRRRPPTGPVRTLNPSTRLPTFKPRKNLSSRRTKTDDGS
jgi:hypothetical protein